MAEIRPFRGLRFDPAKVPLSASLCPPYDVIPPEEARRLRRGKRNAIHLELPEGEGRARYRRAAAVWRGWRRAGVLVRDPEPAFYVCEETFRHGGRLKVRLGFLAALSVEPRNARFVLPHERTLPKPKADRLRLLDAVRANVSPIFGMVPDRRGRLRRELSRARRARPVARGRLGPVGYRLWRLSEPRAVEAVRGAVAPHALLIADGHHRYEVGRAYHARKRRPETSALLAYLCPEEDPGLVVLPTHRVVAGRGLREKARGLARLSPCPSRRALLSRLAGSRGPYAFGLYDGRWALGEPARANGCRSGLGVEWLGAELLAGVPPDRIAYTPDPEKAVRLARKSRGQAVFVKPFTVGGIRSAVESVGLLPPKSTYFYPKVATGLVFHALEA